MTQNQIASELRAARARARLTQSEVAAKVGCHRMTVCRAEDGRPVSPSTIARLVRALNIPARRSK
jgi:DNA-binding XRE family transcriptional regulator